MIISGYQGIGKSTVCNSSIKYIDLESSNFWIEDENGERIRQPYWYKEYCNLAIDLSNHGYTVFVSSHKEVREYLAKADKGDSYLYMVYPDVSLKDEWICKLQKRYDESKSSKDLRALEHAEKLFENDYEEFSKEIIGEKNTQRVKIKDINYDLKYLIWKLTVNLV